MKTVHVNKLITSVNLKINVRVEQGRSYKYSDNKQYDYDSLVSMAVPPPFV
jgi:heme-binding NEAT domain protein